MTTTKQVTIWCDKCRISFNESGSLDPDGEAHIELDVASVKDARLIAEGAGWGRFGRHGDLCPFHNR